MPILPYIVRSKKTIVASVLTLGFQGYLAFDADGLVFWQLVTRLGVSMTALLLWSGYGLGALLCCMYEEQNHASHVKLDAWVSNLVIAISTACLSFLALILQL